MTAFRQKQLTGSDFPADVRKWIEPLLRFVNDANSDCSALLNGGLSLSGNAKAFQTQISLTTKSDWHEIGATGEPAFEHSWVNYGGSYSTAAFRVLDEMVQIKGSIKSGTVGQSAFTLPADARPATIEQFPMLIAAAASGAYLTVNTSGLVIPSGAAGGSTYTSLDGIVIPTPGVRSANAAFPLSFANKLPNGARPAGVLLLGAVDVTTANPKPVSLSQPAWDVSGPNVRILDIAEVQPSRKYQLTLLVIG